MRNLPSRDVVRSKEMFELKQQGKTLYEIGREYGLTGERVRQILNGYNPNWKHSARKHPLHPRVARKNVVCSNCNKSFEVRITDKRVFCSMECYGRTRVKSKMSPAQYEAYSIARRRAWYERNKDNPAFKEATRRRNNGESGFSFHEFEV